MLVIRRGCERWEKRTYDGGGGGDGNLAGEMRAGVSTCDLAWAAMSLGPVVRTRREDPS